MIDYCIEIVKKYDEVIKNDYDKEIGINPSLTKNDICISDIQYNLDYWKTLSIKENASTSSTVLANALSKQNWASSSLGKEPITASTSCTEIIIERMVVLRKYRLNQFLVEKM